MAKRKVKGNPNATISMPVVNPNAAGIDAGSSVSGPEKWRGQSWPCAWRLNFFNLHPARIMH